MEDTYNIGTEIGKVVTQFQGGMKSVADQGIDLLSKAAPYMIAVAGAAVVLGFGIHLIKRIRA